MSEKEYKIVDFNESTGQILVRYRNLPLIAIDLPLDVNNNIPEGDELDLYISGFIPTWHFDRLSKLESGITNIETIRSLVQKEPALPVESLDSSVDMRPFFEASAPDVIATAMQICNLSSSDVLIDLGSGDGAILIAAALLGAKAIGYEIDPKLVDDSLLNASKMNVEIEVQEKDLFEADLTPATVVTMFLNKQYTDVLALKLYNLKSGTKIISNYHPITWWKPESVVMSENGILYMWIVP